MQSYLVHWFCTVLWFYICAPAACCLFGCLLESTAGTCYQDFSGILVWRLRLKPWYHSEYDYVVCWVSLLSVCTPQLCCAVTYCQLAATKENAFDAVCKVTKDKAAYLSFALALFWHKPWLKTQSSACIFTSIFIARLDSPAENVSTLAPRMGGLCSKASSPVDSFTPR